MSLSLSFIVATAFIMSFLASRLMVKAGVSDIPVGRSSHNVPVPTAGGIGVLCGIAAGCLALTLPLGGLEMSPDLPAILSLAFAIALMGLYDDLYAPPTEIKFGVFIAISALLIYSLDAIIALPVGNKIITLPFWLGAIGTLLWVFVATNSVNFMDGANGFMPGCLAIAFTALAALAFKEQAQQTFWLSLIAASAWAGFLPWNARQKALIFAGDIGSLLAGFLFAAAALLFVREVTIKGAVYLGPLLLLPFLTDILLTLLWRLRRGQNLLQPHRDHLYQRAIKNGVSHRSISLIYYAAFVVCGVIVCAVSGRGSTVIFWVFLASIAASILLYCVGHIIWRVKDIN